MLERSNTMLRLTLFAIALGTICGCGRDHALQDALSHGESLDPGPYQTCAPCHGAIAQGDQQANAPGLSHLPTYYLHKQIQNIRDGIRGYHAEDTTTHGCQAAFAKITDDDLPALSSAIQRYQPVLPKRTLSGGSAKRGKKVYGTCAACHGEDGRGLAPVYGPPLLGHHDWYLAHALAQFANGHRGTHKDDKLGLQMAMGINSFLPSPQAQHDVLAYLHVLSKQP